MKLENRFTVPVPVADAWKVLLDVERIAPCMPGATLTSRDGDSFTGSVKVKVGPINLTYAGHARFVSLDEEARVAVIEGSGKETRGPGTAKATVTCRLRERGAQTEVDVETDLAVTGKPAQFGRGVLADVSGKLVTQFAACLAVVIAEPAAPAPTPPAAAAAAAAPAGPPPGAEPPAPATSPAAPAPPQRAEPSASSEPSAPAAPSAPAEPPATQQPQEPTGVAELPAAEAPGVASAIESSARSSAASAGAAAPVVPATRPDRPTPRPSAEPIDLLGTAGVPVLKRLAPALAGVVVLALVIRRLRH